MLAARQHCGIDRGIDRESMLVVRARNEPAGNHTSITTLTKIDSNGQSAMQA